MKNIKKCKICGENIIKPLTCSKKEWVKRVACSRKCRGKWMSNNFCKEKCWNFKGGSVSVQGYRVLSMGRNKRILEHRYVMEIFLGRKLEKFEQVHHINGDKLDNRIENLSLLTKWEHAKHHSNAVSGIFGKNCIKNNHDSKTYLHAES